LLVCGIIHTGASQKSQKKLVRSFHQITFLRELLQHQGDNESYTIRNSTYVYNRCHVMH
jgi:hypothetical protein